MDIMSRQTAIRLRKIRYFTGVPCKHGHLAERYTKTAGCVECLHPQFDNGLPRYREAKRQMIRKRFRVWPENLAGFRATVYALALAREPLMKPSDVEVAGFAPMECVAGYSVHSFWIFAADEPALRLLEAPVDSCHPRAVPVAVPPPLAPETGYWPEGDPR